VIYPGVPSLQRSNGPLMMLIIGLDAVESWIGPHFNRQTFDGATFDIAIDRFVATVLWRTLANPGLLRSGGGSGSSYAGIGPMPCRGTASLRVPAPSIGSTRRRAVCGSPDNACAQSKRTAKRRTSRGYCPGSRFGS